MEHLCEQQGKCIKQKSGPEFETNSPTMQRIRQLLSADIELYDYAVDVFEKRVSQSKESCDASFKIFCHKEKCDTEHGLKVSFSV